MESKEEPGGGDEVKKNTNEPKFTRMKMKNDGLSVSLSAREKIKI